MSQARRRVAQVYACAGLALYWQIFARALVSISMMTRSAVMPMQSMFPVWHANIHTRLTTHVHTLEKDLSMATIRGTPPALTISVSYCGDTLMLRMAPMACSCVRSARRLWWVHVSTCFSFVCVCAHECKEHRCCGWRPSPMTCSCTYLQAISAFVYVYVCIRIYTAAPCEFLNIYMYIYVCVYMHMYIHTYTHTV